jgi:hypothetical protein
VAGDLDIWDSGDLVEATIAVKKARSTFHPADPTSDSIELF